MLNLLLGLLAATICVTFVSVFFMVLCLGYSIKDATRKVRDFIIEVLKNLFGGGGSSPEPQYPTCIGGDGFRIIPQFVNEAFSKIAKNFSVFYYVGFQTSKAGDAIRYCFKIRKLLNFLEHWDLLDLLQKQCEEILTHHLQSYDCYLSAEPLTAVELKDDKLFVYFALNPSGINRLDAIKRKNLKLRALEQAPPTPDPMDESWEDKKGGDPR